MVVISLPKGTAQYSQNAEESRATLDCAATRFWLSGFRLRGAVSLKDGICLHILGAEMQGIIIPLFH